MKNLKILILIFLFSNDVVLAQRVTTLFDYSEPSSIVQMHIHAMSHHWGHTKPSSIQLHSYEAARKSVNALFWTEHSQVYDQYFIMGFNFIDGIIDPVSKDIINIPGNNALPIKYVANFNCDSVSSEINDSTLIMRLNSDLSDTTNQFFTYTPQGKRGELKGTRQFIRPLSSSPILDFYLTPYDLKESGEVIINIDLTYHHFITDIKKHQLQYRLTTGDTVKYINKLNDYTIEIIIPVSDTGRQNVQLDLAEDAKHLLDGLDNTILSYEFGISTLPGSELHIAFDNIRLYSLKSEPLNQYNLFNQFYHNYFQRYDVFGYQGVEWSAKNGMHFNGYLPDTLADKDPYFIPHNQDVHTFTDSIVKAEGLVTLNHPFGSQNYIQTDSILDYRTDTLANYFINNNAFNASIMEVAYDARLGDMPHHLSLWDKLLANNIFIYGNGVNDLHGAGWDRTVNNYCVGIWSKYDNPLETLNALKTGRFYSVNISNTNSRFDFMIGDKSMGYVGEARFFIDTLKYQLDNNLSEAEFRITQGLIQSGLDVEYIYKDYLIDSKEAYFLRLDKPCFIRMTVTEPSKSSPFIISNPIFFTGLTNTVEEISDENRFHIYPNPLKERLNVDFYLVDNTNINISMFNSNGKMIRKLMEESTLQKGWHELYFEIADLPNGVYHVSVDINNSIDTKKVIISN